MVARKKYTASMRVKKLHNKKTRRTDFLCMTVIGRLKAVIRFVH